MTRLLLRFVRIAPNVVWAIPLLAQVVVTCLQQSSYPSGWPLQSLSLTPSSLVDENLLVPSTLCFMHSAGLGAQQVTFHFTWRTPLLLGLGGVSLFLDSHNHCWAWRFIRGKRPANSVGALTSYYSHVGAASG